MEFSITHTRQPEDPKSGVVKIGWFFADETSSVVYFPPERLRTVDMNRTHAKSASRCPAVIGLESRYMMVRCPFEMHLGFIRDDKGKPALKNLMGSKSPVRSSKLNQLLWVTSESEWRFADRPTVQLKLPYMFISDEPVYLSQVPPFLDYQDSEPIPGTLFGGRFPIDVWPRPLMWAFQWHNIKKPIRLKRGQPLFYCQFELDNPERQFQVFEAERAPELQEYCKMITGAVNYVNQTFSLFKRAAEVRPSQLLVKKEKR
ncbi:hypothetical protein N9X05_13645 [Paracoccaceae bacterium]|nr:hypothetical protein [Paracoccaceae bacterium]